MSTYLNSLSKAYVQITSNTNGCLKEWRFMYNRPLMSYQPVELISITISPYISSTSNSLKQISHLRSKKLKVQNFLRWTPSEQLKPEPKSSPQSSVHSIPVGMTYYSTSPVRYWRQDKLCCFSVDSPFIWLQLDHTGGGGVWTGTRHTLWRYSPTLQYDIHNILIWSISLQSIHFKGTHEDW